MSISTAIDCYIEFIEPNKAATLCNQLTKHGLARLECMRPSGPTLIPLVVMNLAEKY